MSREQDKCHENRTDVMKRTNVTGQHVTGQDKCHDEENMPLKGQYVIAWRDKYIKCALTTNEAFISRTLF